MNLCVHVISDLRLSDVCVSLVRLFSYIIDISHLEFKQMFVNKRDAILDDSIPVFHSVGRNHQRSLRVRWRPGEIMGWYSIEIMNLMIEVHLNDVDKH